MTEPEVGEEPSGLLEKMLKETGHKKWKMEPHEIIFVRNELEASLKQRAREFVSEHFRPPS